MSILLICASYAISLLNPVPLGGVYVFGWYGWILFLVWLYFSIPALLISSIGYAILSDYELWFKVLLVVLVLVLTACVGSIFW